MRMSAGIICWSRVFLIVLGCVLLLSARKGVAQDIVDANAGDLDDFRTGFRNPASLSYLPHELVFGSHAGDVGVNPGFFDVGNGYMSYYSPYWKRRFGLSGRFLDTGIFHRTDFGFSYSERARKYVALGGRIDVLNQGFDRGQFRGVDPGDPLLSSGLSKSYVSLTGGVLVVPVPELSLGLVVENINRPDVSFSEDADFRLPLVYDVGAQYRADRLHPSVDIRYEDGVLRYRLRLGVVVRDEHLLRVDYRKEKIGFEGQFRLYEGLHLNYRYQYPLNELNDFSGGSHSISFSYDFSGIVEIPELADVKYSPRGAPLVRSSQPIPVDGDFYLIPSTRLLEISEKHITRKADDDIPVEFIRRNYREIFEESEDTQPAEREATVFYPDTSHVLLGTYTSQYRSSLDSLSLAMGGNESMRTRIYSDSDDMPRAENIREFIAAGGGLSPSRIIITPRDSLPVGTTDLVETSQSDTSTVEMVDLSMIGRTEIRTELSEEAVVFRVLTPGSNNYHGSWSLEIEDRERTSVRSIPGSGGVPDRLTWDWRDDDGELVDPGWYSALLRWEDNSGRPRISRSGSLFVRKKQKDITIELTRKRKAGEVDARRLELRLDE